MASRAMIAKIHIAVKALGIEDDYRAIMAKHCNGKTSSKDLTDIEAAALLARFKAAGWQPTRPRIVKDGHKGGEKKVPNNFIQVPAGPFAKMQRKVLALWNELGYDVEKLHARCKRQFKVDRFEWLQDYNQLHVLITDLKRMVGER